MVNGTENRISEPSSNSGWDSLRHFATMSLDRHKFTSISYEKKAEQSEPFSLSMVIYLDCLLVRSENVQCDPVTPIVYYLQMIWLLPRSFDIFNTDIIIYHS